MGGPEPETRWRGPWPQIRIPINQRRPELAMVLHPAPAVMEQLGGSAISDNLTRPME